MWAIGCRKLWLTVLPKATATARAGVTKGVIVGRKDAAEGSYTYRAAERPGSLVDFSALSGFLGFTTPRNLPGNEMASLFGRWVLPEAGAEIYGEWSRDDRFANLQDLIMEPDLSVVTYRLAPSGTPLERANALNRQIIDFVRRDGRVFLSSTLLDGVFTLRLAVLSFRSHLRTIDLTLRVLRDAASAAV